MAPCVSWGGMWDVFGTLQHLATCKSCNAYCLQCQPAQACGTAKPSSQNPKYLPPELHAVKYDNEKVQRRRRCKDMQSKCTLYDCLIVYARTNLISVTVVLKKMPKIQSSRRSVSWCALRRPDTESCDPSHSFPEGFQTAEDHIVSQPPASAHDASGHDLQRELRYFVFLSKCPKSQKSHISWLPSSHDACSAGIRLLRLGQPWCRRCHRHVDPRSSPRLPLPPCFLPASRASAHGGGGGGVASAVPNKNWTSNSHKWSTDTATPKDTPCSERFR